MPRCASGQAGADGPLPTISVNDVSKPEGQTLDFKITLSAAAEADVTVTAATSGGSGYTARNETVTIPAGQTSANFDIATQGNDRDEADRQLAVTSRSSDNATIAKGTGAGTITDDDATPTVAISGPPPIPEGAVTASYTVTMTGKSASGITVNYTTANGSATAGPNADYDAKSGQLTWAAGETGAKSFDVQIREDTLDENDESFSVNLSGGTGAIVTNGTATTTITDERRAVGHSGRRCRGDRSGPPVPNILVFTAHLRESNRAQKSPCRPAPQTAPPSKERL